MVESEWLLSCEPQPLLEFVHHRVTTRKLRLYLCAAAWQQVHLLGDERSRQAIQVSERFADGLASRSELLPALAAARQAWREVQVHVTGRRGKHGKWPKGNQAGKAAAEAACEAAKPIQTLLAACQVGARENANRRLMLAIIVRDLFGPLPFRAVSVDPSWLSWDGGVVVRLATAIYDARDFEDLPVLADALEEAGCQNPDLLNHLRQPGLHVPGCWALDQLLGRD